MITAGKDVRIGQEVFVLSDDGEVVRTVVGRFEEKGYRFLNGDSNNHPHWFSFEEAVSAANEHIRARQAALREKLRALGRKHRALETQPYRDCVMNAPYRVVDLRDAMSLDFEKLCRTRELKKICVPETYLMPGRVVYVVITPMARSEMEAYRPHAHFVLETEVGSVCFSPDGQVHYTFSTPFIVKEFFLSRAEAEAKLDSFSEPGTKDVAPFVSSKQEREELEKLEEDIPF